MEKTRTNKGLWIGIAVLVLVAIISGWYFHNNRQPDMLKIGVLFPLTGDAASYGEKGQKAIDMAIEQINADGGIHGKNVVVVYEDSRAEPQTGVAAIRKLISIDKVPAVVGDIVSSVTLPAAPIAEKNKVVLLAPTSSAPAITNAGEYIYRIWPSDLAEGKAIARYAYDHGYRRAAIMHLNNDYGITIADIFTKTFNSDDSKVILNEGYLAEDSDFRTVLHKISQANPDVIYLAGYYADISKIMRQAREVGIKQQFLGVTALEDNKFLELAGTSAEGVIYPLATGFDPASSDPVIQKFIRDFNNKYHYEPGWVEAHAYDAFMLISQATQEVSEPVDGTKIKQYLDGMGIYKGATGDIRFDKNGDVTKPVVFKTVRNGEFQPLLD